MAYDAMVGPMFPNSRAAWYVLTLGFLGLLGGMVVTMAVVESTLGCWVVAVAAIGALVVSFFFAKADRHEEEKAQLKRDELMATEPLDVLSREIEESAEKLQRWSTWLALIALVVAVLAVAGACGGQPDAREAFLSSLVWLFLAGAAWFVRSRMSRIASLLILLVPLADIVAALLSRDPEARDHLVMPLFLAAFAGHCCYLTFRYHRYLRHGAP